MAVCISWGLVDGSRPVVPPHHLLIYFNSTAVRKTSEVLVGDFGGGSNYSR